METKTRLIGNTRAMIVDPRLVCIVLAPGAFGHVHPPRADDAERVLQDW